jgi:hypothetical protein
LLPLRKNRIAPAKPALESGNPAGPRTSMNESKKAARGLVVLVKGRPSCVW